MDKDIRHRIAVALLRVHIAEQIKAMRFDRKWSQAKLAKSSGLSVAAIVRLENPYERLPRIGTLRKIAAAFDVGLEIGFTSWGEFADHVCSRPVAPSSFRHDQALEAPK